MNDVTTIESKLVGPVVTKQRRAKLLADLWPAFSGGGSQAITDEMTRRMDILADAFADQLQELKKQL